MTIKAIGGGEMKGFTVKQILLKENFVPIPYAPIEVKPVEITNKKIKNSTKIKMLRRSYSVGKRLLPHCAKRWKKH